MKRFEVKFSSGCFYGNVSKTISTAKFKLVETVYSQTLKLPAHSHESNYFCFVIQGNFTEVFGKHSRLCRPSTLVFHPAGEKHSDYFHAASRCFNLEINAQWSENLKQQEAILNEPADFCGGVPSQIGAKIYKEFCSQDDLSSLIIEGLTLEMLGEAARHSSNRLERVPPRWLTQARELLNERFFENLSLAEVARAVSIHETHLSREFRRYYNCTVGEYIRYLRIEFACRKLSDSNVTIAEIALAAGFFDQSHFGKIFKQHTGMPPILYRKIFNAR
jgi:AraC family transcriptional regulator